MEEAATRQRWRLAAGLALALVPSRLADLSPPVAERAPRPLPPVEAEPMRLSLVAPDLVGTALRLEMGPSFPQRAAPPETGSRAPFVGPATFASLALVQPVAEPKVGWLLALSLASAACVSRGRRRSLRAHRPR